MSATQIALTTGRTRFLGDVFSRATLESETDGFGARPCANQAELAAVRHKVVRLYTNWSQEAERAAKTGHLKPGRPHVAA
jgi:hypothetical protein